MLQRILSMSTLDEFNRVSVELAKANARTELYEDVAREGLVLSADDMMEVDEVSAIASSERVIGAFLRNTSEVEDTRRLVCRLQVICACNLGVEKPIMQFLSRACV